MTATVSTSLAVLLSLAVSLAPGGAGEAVQRDRGPAATRARPGPAVVPGVPGDTAGTRDRIAAVLDSVARRTMARGHIPGLAVVLVRDGAVAWSEGYGRESLEGDRPVAPGATRFAVGSVSKLVTAVAVLQQVEEGRLDLDADVGAYVPDTVPLSGPGGAVTLHHLLTHTAGFESASIGLAARSPGGVEPLREVLVRRMPRRVRPPGLLYLYSQFDYGLAGLAVASVSRRSFERYADERIFSPLGMATASFRPSALRHERAATGYHWTGDGFQPAPTAYHHVPPAGGLVATPNDLGRLVAALLSTPDPGSGGILRPATVDRMFSRQWSPHPHPEVEGTGYGLFEYRACGFRALSTRGWVGGHSTYLHLLPGRGLGYLVVGNGSSLEGLESSLRVAVHRRLPGSRCAEAGAAAPPEGETPGRTATDDDAPGSERALEGVYRSMGFGARGVEALGRLLLSPTLEVRTGGSGPTLDFGGDVEPVVRVDPLLLRAARGPGREEYFSFLGGSGGEPRFLAWEGAVYEKVPGLWRPSTLRVLAGLTGLLLMAGLLAGLGRTLVRRRPRGADGGPRRSERVARLGGLVVSLLPLLFAGGMALHLGAPARYQFAFGIPATALPLLWLPPLWTLAAVGLLPGGRGVWRRRYWSAGERVLWTLVVVAGLTSGVALTVLGLPAV